MKRMTALLLLLCLLTGCARESGEKETGSAGHAPQTPETVPARTETVPSPPQTAPAAGGQVLYSLLENDDSIRSAEGEVLVKILYEQVILGSPEPAVEAVNRAVAEDYRAFRDSLGYLHQTAPEQWQALLEAQDPLYGSYRCVERARVSSSEGGIFSICLTRERYLGDGFSQEQRGLTFDLNTGQQLTLDRLSPLPREEFLAWLKQTVCRVLEQSFDALALDPGQVLQEYTLEDFRFYVEEGELILTFPEGTFGTGAGGAVRIPTGLYPVL